MLLKNHRLDDRLRDLDIQLNEEASYFWIIDFIIYGTIYGASYFSLFKYQSTCNNEKWRNDRSYCCIHYRFLYVWYTAFNIFMGYFKKLRNNPRSQFSLNLGLFLFWNQRNESFITNIQFYFFVKKVSFCFCCA